MGSTFTPTSERARAHTHTHTVGHLAPDKLRHEDCGRFLRLAQIVEERAGEEHGCQQIAPLGRGRPRENHNNVAKHKAGPQETLAILCTRAPWHCALDD